MGFHKPKTAQPHEPSGFTPRSSGRASERAHQQGWQTNQEERTHEPEGKLNSDGGTDYDYGARDFGDLPIDTGSAPPATHNKRRTVQHEAVARPPAKHKKAAA